MKKLLALILALAMALAWSPAAAPATPAPPPAPPAPAPVPPVSAAASGSEEGGDASTNATDVKIGCILVGDENEGYSYAHIKGIQEAIEAIGIPCRERHHEVFRPRERGVL